MNQRFVRPNTRRGKLVLALFVLVIVAGLWPVVVIANHAVLLLGLPVLATWSCLIVLASTGVMLLANRLLPLPESITRAHPPQDSAAGEICDE